MVVGTTKKNARYFVEIRFNATEYTIFVKIWFWAGGKSINSLFAIDKL